MDNFGIYAALGLSISVTIWCWRRIWRSSDLLFFKISFAVMAAIPFVGPFLYLFADMPPRHPPAPREERQSSRESSAILRRWNEREHVYLGWASFVFWALAVVAYWMNDWHPGEIHTHPIAYLGSYT